MESAAAAEGRKIKVSYEGQAQDEVEEVPEERVALSQTRG